MDRTAETDDHEAGRQRLAAAAGARSRLAACGLFDPDWYVRHNPAAAESDLDPLDHYMWHGVAALASPGPLFDARGYLDEAWHLQRGVEDPLAHYLDHGAGEGRIVQSVPDGQGADPLGRPIEPIALLPRTTAQPTVAVVVHVFYVELFGEICRALARLPYRFTLLVTTDEPEKAALIRLDAASHGLDGHLHVVVATNRGRNFGPFLRHFRHAILRHELMLHLHTKKSLYSGADQAKWRQVLLRTLLPATTAVNGLIQRFVDDPSLGVITASPGEAMRYWSYNWLSNRGAARALLDRIGIRRPLPRGMIDYPVGGMFWARTEALAALIDHDWSDADFPDELGQTDGTIMHAIERVVVLVAHEAGYGFAELDYARGLCRPGWSSRNLDQYARASHDGLLDTIRQVDTVSFDVFDTLVTRLCLTPETVRRYLAWQVARYFPEAGDYAAKRVAAEEAARRERPGDVDLDEIHACFRREAGPGWSEAALLFVEREQVALDARTLRPRPIMLKAMQAARMAGKRIVLTSDSYLARRQFDAMLAPFIGLTDAVYLSSERRARKDDGSLWRLVRDEEGAAPLLHVGDNEHSDIQNTADAGIRHFHVMSPAMLFGLSGLDAGAEPDGERPLGDEILLGPVAAHLFASPYLDKDAAGPVLLLEPEDAGTVLFGPLMVAFVGWLARHPSMRHLDRLFFAAREGYFLKRLYDAMRQASGRKDLPPSVYFHCSRRAALAALQGGGLDVDAVLSGAGYHGSIAGFLSARLDFTVDPALRHDRSLIALPQDNEVLRCVMEMLRAPIEAHGRQAASAFTAYAEAAGMTRDVRAGFVDVGYSATMQSAIQTILGRPLVGLYMGVSHAAAQVRGAGGHAFGAFADGDVADFTGGYGLMLEAFLTAPHGQVVGYDETVTPPTPLFRADGLSQQSFPFLERIYQGVERYALELVRCYRPDLLDLPFPAATATSMLQAFRDGRIRLAPEIMAALSVEDDFCGNGEIPVFRQLSPAGG